MSEQQINTVRVKLTNDPLVREVTFVSKAEALERMRKLQPEIVENLPGNPLPDAFGDGARRRRREGDQPQPADAGSGRSGEDQRRRGGV